MSTNRFGRVLLPMGLLGMAMASASCNGDVGVGVGYGYPASWSGPGQAATSAVPVPTFTADAVVADREDFRTLRSCSNHFRASAYIH
jgi:hypothetical protein